MYRLHHDMEVGMGLYNRRAKSPRIVYIPYWLNVEGCNWLVPWLKAIGNIQKLILIGRFTHSPSRRYETYSLLIESVCKYCGTLCCYACNQVKNKTNLLYSPNFISVYGYFCDRWGILTYIQWACSIVPSEDVSSIKGERCIANVYDSIQTHSITALVIFKNTVRKKIRK